MTSAFGTLQPAADPLSAVSEERTYRANKKFRPK